MAKCEARLVVEAGNARLLAGSIAADNQGYVETYAEDGRMVAIARADSVGTLLATLDDLLVNLKVAGEILGGHGPINGQED
ncbi:MAG: hypothetical protein A4E28_03003 [Methanocella sp. PtaU1.Bin125]|nr:MAG: hypothetical protein A4E28_03003 [Methanocella sp. PtaU1.Bin125]